MAKRKEGESFKDYRARCKAESKNAKCRKGWIRWPSIEANDRNGMGEYTVPGLPLAGTYIKKTAGPIPELRFKKEHE